MFSNTEKARKAPEKKKKKCENFVKVKVSKICRKYFSKKKRVVSVLKPGETEMFYYNCQ